MARLQFQPATQRKGFRPVQVSTEGISRMREETNRVVQGMKQNAEAEKAQRDRELQALKEDTAYSEKIAQQNYETEQRNLSQEVQKSRDIAQRDAQQSQYTSQAQQNVLESISAFSVQAQKKAAENTANQLKDQTDIAMSMDISDSLITQEALTNYNKNVSALTQGATQETTQIIENEINSGGTLYSTTRALADAAGLGAVGRRVLRNRIYSQSYNVILGKALKSTENEYQLADGTPFSGIEAFKDPEKQRIIQQQVTKQLSGMMRETYGITDPLYLAVGKTKVEEQNALRIKQATQQGANAYLEQLRQQAADIASGGKAENYSAAFDLLRKIDGPIKAHDSFYNMMLNATEEQYREGMSIDLMGNGKTYAEQWPGKYRGLEAARQQQRDKALIAAQRQQRAEFQGIVNLNRQQIIDSITENPEAGFRTMQQFAAQYGQGVPEDIKRHYSDTIKNMSEETRFEIIRLRKYSALDQNYVNQIGDDKLRKYAQEQFNSQEENMYGPVNLKIKEGLAGDTRRLVGLKVGDGKTGQSFLVEALYDRVYKENLRKLGSPQLAYQATMDEAAKAKTSKEGLKTDEDKKNRFRSHTIPGTSQMIFPEAEELPKAQKTRLLELDKLLSRNLSASDIISQPSLLGSEQEMDAVIYQSKNNVTQILFPSEVLRVAKKYGLKPSEVYNQDVIDYNKANGTNKPLLGTDSPRVQMMDSVDPDLAAKLNSPSNRVQLNALSQITGRTNNFTRSSFRNETSLNTYSPQVSSITYDTGQPGIDVFFEDHNFPAVLSGQVKDIGYQVNPNGSGYGHYLVVESIDPETGQLVDVLYGHLPSKPSQSIGQSIGTGEIIGKQGGTGSVQSFDGTIASIDFLSPAPAGSGSMTPYANYDRLRRNIASQLKP